MKEIVSSNINVITLPVIEGRIMNFLKDNFEDEII
jgi:hypothetical protein